MTITYEDSAHPQLAVAPDGYNIPTTMDWVRSHAEPMILRDSSGGYVLVFQAANGSIMIEGPAFWKITSLSDAARKMRLWLDNHGLILDGG